MVSIRQFEFEAKFVAGIEAVASID